MALWSAAVLPAAAAESNPVAAASGVPPPAPTPNYPTLLLHDARTVLTAPVRWDRKDWLMFSADCLLVAGVSVCADEAVTDYVAKHNTQEISDAFETIEPLGAEYGYGVLAAFYAGGWLADNANARQVAEDGLAACILADVIITPILKEAVGRSRPIVGNGTYDFHPFSGARSFPSGHTTMAFAVGSVIAEHYDSRWIKGLSYGMATLVGLARIDHMAHYPSDVVAGALIGITVGKTVVRTNEGERTRPEEERLRFSVVAGKDFTGAALQWSF